MSWNYRLVFVNSNYEIREVYYKDFTNKVVVAISTEPVSVSTDDYDGLRWMTARFVEAIDKPVLDYAKLVAAWDRKKAKTRKVNR